MTRSLVCLLAVASCSMFAAQSDDARLAQSAEVLKDIAGAGDKGIPKDLFGKAQCAIVVPNLKKAGFIVGAKFGRGFASCRTAGGWSAPSAVRIEGGSFGLQAGGAESDIILLVMDKKGMLHLLGSKFTLGGDATAAAGPVGRDTSAQTDASLHAEILSYSRSRGVFAGISLDGSTLRPDEDTNKAIYGPGADPKSILAGKTPAPAAAKDLLARLAQFGGR